MVNNQRTGNADLIRAHVAANPNCTAREIGDAIGMNPRLAAKFVDRMLKAGTLIATRVPVGGSFRNHLTLGREPKFKAPRKQAPKRDRSEYQKAKRAAARAVRVAAPPKPAKVKITPGAIPAETSFDYEERGGTIERLPSTWEPRGRYPWPTVPLHQHARRAPFLFGEGTRHDD